MPVTMMPGQLEQAGQNFVAAMLAGAKVQRLQQGSELLGKQIELADMEIGRSEKKWELEQAFRLNQIRSEQNEGDLARQRMALEQALHKDEQLLKSYETKIKSVEAEHAEGAAKVDIDAKEVAALRDRIATNKSLTAGIATVGMSKEEVSGGAMIAMGLAGKDGEVGDTDHLAWSTMIQAASDQMTDKFEQDQQALDERFLYLQGVVNKNAVQTELLEQALGAPDEWTAELIEIEGKRLNALYERTSQLKMAIDSPWVKPEAVPGLRNQLNDALMDIQRITSDFVMGRIGRARPMEEGGGEVQRNLTKEQVEALDPGTEFTAADDPTQTVRTK